MATEIIIPPPRTFLKKQIEVFDIIFDETLTGNRYVLYSGAFGSGKTLLGANVGIKACLDYPGCIGLVGSLTYSQMRDVVFRKFVSELDLYQKALDEHNIPYQIVDKITVTAGKMNIRFTNGSEIWFRSCDRERNLAGKDVDWFYIDEAVDVDESVMTQMIGRLRHDAMPFHFGLLATNPSSESHWIYKYFFIDKLDGYYVVETNTYDNVLIPNYYEYIDNMKRRYDADWVRRYLDGKWGAFTGQVFKNFDRNKHVKKLDLNELEFDFYVAGVDWGVRDPSVVLIIGVTKDKTLYIIDEYYESERTSIEIAKYINDLNKFYKFRYVFIDPTALDLLKQTYEHGIHCAMLMKTGEVKSLADNNLGTGISKIQALLKNNKIIINSKCTNMCRSLSSYRYRADGDKIVEDDSNHCVDALRYAVTFYAFDNNEDMLFGSGRWIKKRFGVSKL